MFTGIHIFLYLFYISTYDLQHICGEKSLNLSSCQAVFLPEGQFVSMGQNLMSEFLMLCSSGRRSTKSQTMFRSHIRVFSTTRRVL